MGAGSRGVSGGGVGVVGVGVWMVDGVQNFLGGRYPALCTLACVHVAGGRNLPAKILYSESPGLQKVTKLKFLFNMY